MKAPYTCPVCGGNGLVPQGFYNQTSGQWISVSTCPEMCRSCNGSGIVWGPPTDWQIEPEQNTPQE